ncbi:EcsC family protein [Cutibacterium equinum]|uniref:EcsC family protein n=1 Tax=Cutibacterium equinum TaxID=3016342 RepID=A0ABY7QXF7_9ACTN|nr:EcsC family protein [Cutibacterium equinum]WCC79738.1 EcsC family protein [Cutibacterium equinum]
MGIGSNIGKALLSQAPDMAPGAAVSMLRSILGFAIEGGNGLPGARQAAGKTLTKSDGNVEQAINSLVNQHIAMAGAQGFVSNLGGIVTLAVTIPANISGVAIVQARMVATIAHLRGYDLDDQRVRTAILATLLGQREVDSLIHDKTIPTTPMGIATAPVSDADLEKTVARHLINVLMGQVAGKKLPVFVSKRVPVLGGGVGATTDGFTTWSVARYARKQFPTRRPRS